MSKIDQSFQALCKKILLEGREYENKNRGVKRLQIPSYTLRHEFKDGFPAITNKKLYWKGIVGELIWFLRGDNDVKYLNDNGIKIWNKDAYNWYKKHYNTPITNIGKEKLGSEMLSFEEFEKRGGGSVGRNYSCQWRNFNGNTDQINILIDDMKKDIMSSRLKVNAWNPSEVDMTALPPCFTEDTLICTEQGYKKIIDVVLEDKVLTKEGDFKSVYDVMITPYVGSLVGIKRKGDTDMIKCTPNHKFFVRGKGWVESLFIEEGDYVGVPINTQNIIPDISYSKSSNQFSSTTKEYKTDMNNYDLWWVMGYFLGDGWIRKDRNDIQFAVSHKESDIVLPKLKSVFGNILKGQASGKSDRYTATSVEYHNLFSLFGSGAENKSIPAFIINAPTNLVKEFIDGYRMADGTKTKEELEFGTISKSIAYGCQILLAKLGIACAVTIGNKKPYHVIEGRTVKQFEKYYIVKQYSGIIKDVEVDLDENTIWYRVTDKFLFKDMDVNVYNISVVDSHTYTCNNIITKNCHSEFQVIGVPLEDGKFGFELHLQQRSTDVFLGAPFNIASYGLLAKILEMFTGYEALAIDLTFKCVHFYDNQYDAARELLSRDPKTHPNCELQIDFPKLDNPDHFSLDDKLDLMKIDQFKLIGYTSDAEIKVEMLAPKE